MSSDNSDFAALLEDSLSEAEDWFEVGDEIDTKIVHIGDEAIFVDLGGKTEGAMNVDEFIDDEGNFVGKVGDPVKAYVIATRGGIKLSKSLRIGPENPHLLHTAFEKNMPVDGKVEEAVKGGFQISISGIRAFCPVSQIDERYTEDVSVHVGQMYSFKITRFEEAGRNIVVSRRALLEIESQKRREETMERLEVGAVFTGRIVNIRDFGAFADIGGLQGLIPIGEMSWVRINHPADVLKVDDEVELEVIGYEPGGERLTLSMKAMQQDPWTAAIEDFPPGATIRGHVVRIQPFGAFVQIAPGVEGLLHISKLGEGRRLEHPSEVVELGEELGVEVASVDPDRRRISLKLPDRILSPEEVAAEDARHKAQQSIRPGQLFDGEVERIEHYGIFVKLPGEVTGLVPNAEMGTSRGTDHRRTHPPGTKVKVMVVEVDNQRRRYRLSIAKAKEAQERAEFQEFIETQDKSEGFGTLGDLLRGKV